MLLENVLENQKLLLLLVLVLLDQVPWKLQSCCCYSFCFKSLKTFGTFDKYISFVKMEFLTLVKKIKFEDYPSAEVEPKNMIFYDILLDSLRDIVDKYVDDISLTDETY